MTKEKKSETVIIYRIAKSNAMNKSILIVLPLAFMLCTTAAYSQMYNRQRHISRSFGVMQNTNVQVINKYGNIQVISWEKDSVRIVADIIVKAKQAAKADKILSAVDFNFFALGNFIDARTVFSDNQNTFWKDMVSVAGQMINAGNNLEIDYKVYMPAKADLILDNKFGNIYIESLLGNADIKLSHGDMQARDFSGFFKLNLDFGSATMQDIHSAEIIVNYSDITLRKADRINLNSRSSTIIFDEVNTIDMSSRRDEISVKNLSSINGDSYFSNIKINQFNNTATLTLKYGGIKMSNITHGFSTIHLDSEYADLLLNFNQGVSYNTDLSYDAKTKVSLSPAMNSQLKKETLNAKIGTVHSSGNIGKSTTSAVFISAKSGSLTIFNK
jgi:hypothetical protein